MTSRWVSEVSEVRGFEVTWHPVSLAIINENADPEADYMKSHRVAFEQSLRMGRIAVAAEAELGQSAVAALYTALGTKIHPGGRKDYEALISEAVAEALPADFADAAAAAAENTAFDEELRANTTHALEIAGPDVGVPVISVNGVAFFGPVVTPAPTGETALQLWDGIVAAASVPGFYELKRGRTVGPQF